MGPLQRTDRDTETDARIERARNRGSVGLAVETVRRRFAPYSGYVIERLVRLFTCGSSPRRDAINRRPPQRPTTQAFQLGHAGIAISPKLNRVALAR